MEVEDSIVAKLNQAIIDKELAAKQNAILDPYQQQIRWIGRYRWVYGEHRAMFELMKRLPRRDIPSGPHTYCQKCDSLSPWIPGQWRWDHCRKCGDGWSDIIYIHSSSFSNPLQDYWIRVNVRPHENSLLSYPCRDALISSHGFAVPDDKTINAIARYGPVVEMGAGRGYWAWCLRQVGCDVIAYNEDVPPQSYQFHKFSHMFFPVQVGTPSTLRFHGDRTLLLVWPPYDDPMAADCLRHWKGKFLCYVGEGYGDCTADDTFHETLEQCFEKIDWIPMSNWYGVHDSLFVYRRKVPYRLMKKRLTRAREEFRKKELQKANDYRRQYRYCSDQMGQSIWRMSGYK